MTKDQTDENLVLIIIYTQLWSSNWASRFFSFLPISERTYKNAHTEQAVRSVAPKNFANYVCGEQWEEQERVTELQLFTESCLQKGNRLCLLYISYYIVHHVLKPNNKKEPSEVQYSMHTLMIWTREKIFCFRWHEIILYNSLIGWILSVVIKKRYLVKVYKCNLLYKILKLQNSILYKLGIVDL